MRYIFAWISAVLMTGSAFAEELMGQPTPGALGFQPSATRIMERINDFHYQGLTDPVVGNDFAGDVYLAAIPEDFRVSLVALFFEYALSGNP